MVPISMSRNQILLLLILLRTKVLPEVITLTKHNNVTCLLLGDSVYSSVYITQAEFTHQQRSLTEININLDNDWRLINAHQLAFAPVTHLRWQNFKIIGSNSSFIFKSRGHSFSVYTDRMLKFEISEKNLLGLVEQFTFPDRDLPKKEWLHFTTVTKENAVEILVDGVLYKKVNLSFKPYAIKLLQGTLKYHDYKLKHSTQTNIEAPTNYHLPFFEKTKCISMFVSVDKHCFLDIILKSGNNSVTEHVEGFNEENSLKYWIRKEIKLNISENATLTLIKRRQDGNRAGFWAIDKMHYCKEQDSFSLEVSSPDVEYVCNELNPTSETGHFVNLLKILNSPGYFVKQFKIDCNILDEKYPDCKHYKICVRNKCYCAWGYTGPSCTETCSPGYWGLNCLNRCILGCDSHCNFIMGCQKDFLLHGLSNDLENKTVFTVAITSTSHPPAQSNIITNFIDTKKINYTMTKTIEIKSKVELKNSECIIPTISLSSENKELLLQWRHKIKKAEIVVEIYTIKKDDGSLRQYKINVEGKNNKTISVDYNHEYMVIWSVEGCKNATYNVTVLGPIRKLSEKPVTEICLETCFLLLSVFNNVSYYVIDIVVIKRSKIYTTNLLEIYNSVKNDKGLTKEEWIVNWAQWKKVTIDNYTDAIYVNINHNSAVSLKNDTFINCIVVNESNVLSVYTIPHPWDKEDEANNLQKIATIAILVLQLLMCIFVIVIFKKELKKICFKTNIERSSETVPLQNIVIDNDEDTRNIKKENFIEYLNQKLEKKQLEEEFLTFPDVTGKTMWEAQRDQNKNKNKNKVNIFPYDHNRVILKELKGVGSSDYINASYINGVDRSRAYIASQGPKFFTLRDFWRMIWQENIESIVMATNYMNDSGNNRLCAEYLPPNVDSIFECGSLTVTLVSEQNYEYYVKRKLMVHYYELEREICHIHIKWRSDYFLYPNDLIPTIKEIRKMYEKSLHPILIHSGFGTTRTGILILCDMVLEMLKRRNTLNIHNLAKNLREQRCNLINSAQEYILVHLIVSEYIMKEEYYPFSTNIRENPQEQNFKNQLKYIKKLCDYDKIVRSWMPELTENNQPILFADGYGKSGNYIVKQQLRKNNVNTITAFWTLVAEESVNCIVLLNKMKKKCKCTYEDVVIKVECTEVTETCAYVLRTMSLLMYYKISKKKKHQKKIVLYELKEETKRSSMFPNNILQLICEVEKYSKIIVSCNDGVTMCGLFLVLAYIIAKYATELEIDVGNAIRVTRRSGPQFLNTTEQLKLVYLCIREYSENFERYKVID